MKNTKHTGVNEHGNYLKTEMHDKNIYAQSGTMVCKWRGKYHCLNYFTFYSKTSITCSQIGQFNLLQGW